MKDHGDGVQRLWGAVVASSLDAEPMPEGTEARLAQFTGLLAIAIANAESHAALERLADEQAALRRVATIVAQAAPSAAMFSAVSDEVDGLFDCGAAVARFEDDPPATVFSPPAAGWLSCPLRAQTIIVRFRSKASSAAAVSSVRRGRRLRALHRQRVVTD